MLFRSVSQSRYPSDNLPSIPGVGEKTVTKWIQEFGTLKELVAKVDTVPGKAGEALRAALPSVLTNRELTQLRHDLPLHPALENLEWRGVDFAHINKLFDTLEIKALKDRIKALNGEEAKVESKPSEGTLKEIGRKELEKLLKQNELIPLVLSENSAALSFNPGEVVTINRSEISDILLTEERWIIHGAKVWIRSGVLRKVAVDTEVASYLLNPGSRDIELLDVLRKYCGVEISPSSADVIS